MRMRRLMADWHGLRRLADDSALIDIACSGYPPQQYLVTYRCNGLVRPTGADKPALCSFHQLEVYLHLDYPRLQPRLTWQTEIFHPNILSRSRNGGVCIGAWTPAESLAALIVRIGEMVQYKSYNPADPMDREAAAWALDHAQLFPVDARPLLREAVHFDRPGPSEYIEVSL